MRSRRRVVSLVWSMLVICAASLVPPLRAQFVYVANAFDDNISAYSIGATGALTPIGAPVAAGPTPGSVASLIPVTVPLPFTLFPRSPLIAEPKEKSWRKKRITC